MTYSLFLNLSLNIYNHLKLFFSHLLSEETTPVTKPSIPTSVPTVGKKFKPRANPFNDEQTHLKRNASSVAYCEIVKPVTQLQPSPKPHQPTKMLDNFVESSSVASSSSSYEEPPYKYDIPSYHPKLVRKTCIRFLNSSEFSLCCF